MCERCGRFPKFGRRRLCIHCITAWYWQTASCQSMYAKQAFKARGKVL